MSRKPSAQPVEGAPEDEAYEVGYGKPPKHTRFKPGQSGNPKGRPRGRRNFRTAVREALQEKIPVREGNRTRKVSKMDAIIQVTFNKALKGEPKGVSDFIQLARASGLMDEEPDTAATNSVGAEDEAIIDAFLARRGVKRPADDGEVRSTDEDVGSTAPEAKADEDKGSEDQP